MITAVENVDEYVSALKKAEQFTKQVVKHHTEEHSRAQKTSINRLSPLLQKALHKYGINQLYSHQTKAIEQILSGQHVIVSTPTASGKSLIYTLPVLETLINTPSAKALFVFPRSRPRGRGFDTSYHQGTRSRGFFLWS